MLDYIWSQGCDCKSTVVNYSMVYNCDHRPIFTTASVTHTMKQRRYKRHVDWKCAETVSPLRGSLAAPGARKILLEGRLHDIQGLFEQVIDGAPNTRAKSSMEKYPIELRNSFAALQDTNEELDAHTKVKMAKDHYRLKRAWVNSERIKKLSQIDLAKISKGTGKKQQTGPNTLFCKGIETVDRGLWRDEISDNFAALYHDGSISACAVNQAVHDELFCCQTARLHEIRMRAAAETQKWFVPLWLVLECRARFASKSAPALGADSITWEFLSALPINVTESLRTAFETRLCDTAVTKPKNAMWGQLLTKLIPKPSDVRLLKNWRPICLSSCIQKWCCAVLGQTIDQVLEPLSSSSI